MQQGRGPEREKGTAAKPREVKETLEYAPETAEWYLGFHTGTEWRLTLDILIFST